MPALTAWYETREGQRQVWFVMPELAIHLTSS